MVSEKLADRLIKDLPTMSTEELALAIDVAQDMLIDAASAEERATVIRLRIAISAELERRNPQVVADGP